jgi:hypothetical protein
LRAVGTFVPNRIAFLAGVLSWLPALRHSLAALVSHAGARGMGKPSLTLVAQERFEREARV